MEGLYAQLCTRTCTNIEKVWLGTLDIGGAQTRRQGLQNTLVKHLP